MANSLETAKAEVKRLSSELHRAQQALHRLECEATGIAIGDVVLYKGIEHRVTRIETWANPPWLHGLPKKKNGEFGKKERCLYGQWVKP